MIKRKIPDYIGKYQIQSVLGRGAAGVVYKAIDPSIGRIIAIKTVRKSLLGTDDASILTRFQQEARAVGLLTHPGIVPIYEYNDYEDSAYIAMEFVAGRELKAILGANERFSRDAALDIVISILDALEYAHANGVIHRDIKPANIMIDNDGNARITDFGVAKLEDSTLTKAGDIIGTPAYMSPEQFRGQIVDERSDLFAVGVLLYELLTGEKPFLGNQLTTVMHRVLTITPDRPSSLNTDLCQNCDTVILKAVAKNKQDRFQSAREFADTLKELKAAEAGTSNVDSIHSNDHMSAKSRTDHLSKTVVSSLFLIVLLLVGTWYILPQFTKEYGTSTRTSVFNSVVLHQQSPLVNSANTSLGKEAIGKPNGEQTQVVKEGIVKIESTPPGVAILLDGKRKMGTTPTTINLAYGNYSIVFRNVGYLDGKVVIIVNNEEVIHVSMLMVDYDK